MSGKCPFASRRAFLAGAGGVAAAAGATVVGRAGTPPLPMVSPGPESAVAEPFHGPRQGGIITPQQRHTFFAAFDLTTPRRDDVAALLRAWTDAAARLTQGQTAAPLAEDLNAPAADSGEALGLPAARLTITFGFGPGMFARDGADRYGLAARRPEALADLPRFNGDQLIEAKCGGDLSVQACADDPQVAFHAVRQFGRIAYDRATMRWAQTGFVAGSDAEETPRNLMGFRDGTQNPGARRVVTERFNGRDFTPGGLDDVVWVGDEGPSWLRGGSFLVVRRIRMALEHWDRTDVSFQEQVIGRHKATGAPLGSKEEFDPLDLDAADADGNPLVPETAHVRLGSASANGGAQILRRAYSYNDGVNFVAERWPPWRQGMEYDAGLFFVAYQRDPRTGFSRIFERMSKLDMLNQFTTHVGSAIFACPPGIRPGEFVGEALFRA